IKGVKGADNDPIDDFEGKVTFHKGDDDGDGSYTVKSVESNDLKTIVTTFNTEIAAATANEDTIIVKAKDGSTLPIQSYVTSEDKKTTTMILDGSASENQEVTITIDGVQSADNHPIEKWTGKITLHDTKNPVL